MIATLRTYKVELGLLAVILGVALSMTNITVPEGQAFMMPDAYATNRNMEKPMSRCESIFVSYGLFGIWLGDRIEGKKKTNSLQRERRKARDYLHSPYKSSLK